MRASGIRPLDGRFWEFAWLWTESAAMKSIFWKTAPCETVLRWSSKARQLRRFFTALILAEVGLAEVGLADLDWYNPNSCLCYGTSFSSPLSRCALACGTLLWGCGTRRVCSGACCRDFTYRFSHVKRRLVSWRSFRESASYTGPFEGLLGSGQDAHLYSAAEVIGLLSFWAFSAVKVARR